MGTYAPYTDFRYQIDRHKVVSELASVSTVWK